MRGARISISKIAVKYCSYWLVATTTGIVFGVLVAFSLLSVFSSALTFSLVGLSVGFSQWLVIRKLISKPANWILVSFIGWNAGFGIVSVFADLLRNVSLPIDPGIMLLFAGGAVLGIIQWLVLHQAFTKSLLWIFSSATSWGFVGFISNGTLVGFGDLLAVALIRGSIMGITLFLIMHDAHEMRLIEENAV